MRILHIIPTLHSGGAERLSIDIVDALSRIEGIEVALVIFRKEITYDVRDIENLIHVIPSSIRLSLHRKNELNVSALQKFINDFEPDIIHTHLFEAEIVAKSCLYPKAKWFCHFHDNMPQLKNFSMSTLRNKTLMLNFFEKQYLMHRTKLNGINQYIAISKDSEHYAKEVLDAKNPVHYLKNAIDFNKFFAPVKKDLAPKTWKLINVGSFQKKKNQQFLMEVLHALGNKNIEVCLELLGDGICRNEVEEKARQLGVFNETKFLGNVINVPKYLWEAHIYVHSASYEPFGLVLLEAMAAGLPVVSLNGGGNLDITTHNENGYIFDKQDALVFANCIIQLTEDQDTYKRIASAGQNSARNFDISDYAMKLLSIYRGQII